ncbi:hypothetical protein E2C01_087472 [Portunus trituberculatus]|uniref:Uncharacterized protein n=1 Tax=Portunus trituberculatus TaxID=210409 RepID=A0A5B7JJB8_PORTR|nr:hypothetical protein [Portunus trituberculatus]
MQIFPRRISFSPDFLPTLPSCLFFPLSSILLFFFLLLSLAAGSCLGFSFRGRRSGRNTGVVYVLVSHALLRSAVISGVFAMPSMWRRGRRAASTCGGRVLEGGDAGGRAGGRTGGLAGWLAGWLGGWVGGEKKQWYVTPPRGVGGGRPGEEGHVVRPAPCRHHHLHYHYYYLHCRLHLLLLLPVRSSPRPDPPNYPALLYPPTHHPTHPAHHRLTPTASLSPLHNMTRLLWLLQPLHPPPPPPLPPPPPPPSPLPPPPPSPPPPILSVAVVSSSLSKMCSEGPRFNF